MLALIVETTEDIRTLSPSSSLSVDDGWRQSGRSDDGEVLHVADPG